MKFSAKQYAQYLYDETVDQSNKDIKIVVDNFFDFLKKNNDLRLINKVIEIFSSLYDREAKIVNAEVVSAHNLGKESLKDIREYILLLAKAKEVNIKETIDKDLLGGVIIKYGDKVLDGSMKSRIEQLKISLEK